MMKIGLWCNLHKIWNVDQLDVLVVIELLSLLVVVFWGVAGNTCRCLRKVGHCLPRLFRGGSWKPKDSCLLTADILLGHQVHLGSSSSVIPECSRSHCRCNRTVFIFFPSLFYLVLEIAECDDEFFHELLVFRGSISKHRLSTTALEASPRNSRQRWR